MKKFFIFLIVVFLLVLIGLAIFIITFDGDRYRLTVVSQLEQVLDKEVELKEISLGWDQGIALKLKGLSIFPRGLEKREPLVRLAAASAVLEIAQLFNGKIQIGSINLRKPEIYLVHGRNGRIKGLEPAPSQKVQGVSQALAVQSRAHTAPKTQVPLAPFLSLMIREVRLEDGLVFFRDETKPSSAEMALRNIGVTVRNVVLDRPMPLHAQATLLSDRQNLDLKANLFISARDRAVSIQDLHFKTDLSDVNYNDLVQIFPALRDMGFTQKISGVLTADVASLRLDPTGIQNFDGTIHLSEGRLEFVQPKRPIENMVLEATFHNDRLQLESFSAQIAGGEIAASGTVNGLGSRPQTVFHLTAAGILLDQFFPVVNPDEPQLTGRLRASFQGTFGGSTWLVISQTLSGQGQLTLEEGAVRNFNILEDLFRRLSLIPGLVEKLKERLPPSYLKKLEAPDAILEPIQLSFLITNGALSFRQLHVTTDTFQLASQGVIGLNGAVSAQAILHIDPDFSNALIGSVNELRYLTDSGGRLEIPLLIQGTLLHIVVFPDLGYVASRLAISKTTELIGGLVQKKFNSSEGGPTQETNQNTPRPSLTQTFLGQLLQTIPQGSETSGASS